MNRLSDLFEKLPALPLLGWFLQYRFVKFGIVGFTGMLINLCVLYLGQEVVFEEIHSKGVRLDLSLGLAILVSTISNYIWNRRWTWDDRKHAVRRHFAIQMGRYFVASWLAIALQFLFTKLLTEYEHYLLANLMAVALAAFVNFIINDIWTFALNDFDVKNGGEHNIL